MNDQKHTILLQSLPSTEVLRARLTRAIQDRDRGHQQVSGWASLRGLASQLTPPDLQPLTGPVERLEHYLQLAQERDSISARRPAGCFCLGLGGRGRAFTSNGTELWAETCGCPEGRVEQVKITNTLAHLADAEATVRKLRIWRVAEIPDRFQGWNLASSPLHTSNPKLMRTLLDWDCQRSWYFWGPYGRGKTGLAVGLARLALDTQDRPGMMLFRAVPQLLSEIRATYSRDEGQTEADLLALYTKTPLLILDDLGAEQVKPTGWVADRLYQIIGDRHANDKTTIYTSNLDIDTLRQKIGDRICWRIIEMCGEDHIVELRGANLR